MGRDRAGNKAAASGMVNPGDGTQAIYIVDPKSIQEIGPGRRQETSPYLQLRVPG